MVGVIGLPEVIRDFTLRALRREPLGAHEAAVYAAIRALPLMESKPARS